MADMHWSDEQLRAIRTRDRTLLISAAAGSGKTAVLTERVIRSLTEGAHPLDLSRILVTTFTGDAANVLRGRIGRALAAALNAADGDDADGGKKTRERLSRQIRLLPAAQISTIHSFCLSVLRRYAPALGLRPDMRVLDPQQAAYVTQELMLRLLDDGYAGLIPDVPPSDFAVLAGDMTGTQTAGRLADALLAVYANAVTLRGGVEELRGWADRLRQEAERPLTESRWWRLISALVQDTAVTACAQYDAILNDMRRDEPDVYEAYGEALQARGDVIRSLTPPADDYISLQNALNIAYPRFGARKGVPKTAQSDAVGELRRIADAFKKDVQKIRVTCFLYTEAEWRGILLTTAARTDTTAAVLREFDRRYRQEMRVRGAVDFNQMERFTYELLTENGGETEAARALRGAYDAVYVDEYQDVSPLQNALFEAIGGERNRFMVGDIKQSIYRFRHADPGIFAAMKRNLPPLADGQDQPAAALLMRSNFRCDLPVVAFVNAVFDFAFGNAGDSIAYRPEDSLNFAKTKTAAAPATPVIALFNRIRRQDDPALTGDACPDITDEEEAEEAATEAEWVADQIADLLQNGTRADGVTRLTPADFAILMRSNRGPTVAPFAAALAVRGIPVDSPDTTEYFRNPEVSLAVSLLSVIDNPRRDVPLSAVLLSPLYGFTPDDLTEIRRAAEPGVPLFEALASYCRAHPDFERGTGFLCQLADFRQAAEGMPVYRLLSRIFTETPLLAIAGNNGRGGENNLKVLDHYARGFEGSSFGGLYEFVRFIRSQSGKFRSPRTGSDAAGVHLMTVHASKGLEFPVVFLCGVARPYNRSDRTGNYLFDGEWGMAFLTRDAKTGLRMRNPLHACLSNRAGEATAEEELRILYVALTRAEERLFVTATVSGLEREGGDKPTDRYLREAALLSRFPSRHAVLSQNAYLPLILAARALRPETAELTVDPPLTGAVYAARPSAEPAPDAMPDPGEADRLAAVLRGRFGYVYPDAYRHRLPKKLSVSRLTPVLLDGTEDETAAADATGYWSDVLFPTRTETPDDEDRPATLRMPEACAGTRPPDAAERGTATHLFMQFCDFDLWEKHGVEAEIRRLVTKRFLDERTADAIRRQELETFRRSALFRMMRGAERVRREFRFHVTLPAADFTADPALRAQLDGATLFIQGVMDAVIEHPDGTVTLIDYKTDRLTREERADPALAAAKLRARHGEQLRYYAAAVERIWGQPPREILIYSLHLGDTVTL